MVVGGGPGGLPLRIQKYVNALRVGVFSASKKLSRGNTSRFRHVLYTASASSAAVGAAATVAGASRRNVKSSAFLKDVGSPARRCTDVMLGVNILCFMLQKLSKDIITVYGAKITTAILAGQYWRLLTAGVLHSTAVHLLVNMYTLHNVGPHLEQLGGRKRFFAVYIAASLGGTCLSCIYAPNVMSVGSSCAIFGLFGAVGMYYWRHRALLKQRSRRVFNALGATLVMNLLLALAIRKLDHWGHIGGVLGGAAAAWLLGPRLVPTEQGGHGQGGWYEDQPPLPALAFQDARNTL